MTDESQRGELLVELSHAYKSAFVGDDAEVDEVFDLLINLLREGCQGWDNMSIARMQEELDAIRENDIGLAPEPEPSPEPAPRPEPEPEGNENA